MTKLHVNLLSVLAAFTLFACGTGASTISTEETSEGTEETTTALEIEKPSLKFGFIKLTDMAPLAIAKEQGYFEDDLRNTRSTGQLEGIA